MLAAIAEVCPCVLDSLGQYQRLPHRVLSDAHCRVARLPRTGSHHLFFYVFYVDSQADSRVFVSRHIVIANGANSSGETSGET